MVVDHKGRLKLEEKFSTEPVTPIRAQRHFRWKWFIVIKKRIARDTFQFALSLNFDTLRGKLAICFCLLSSHSYSTFWLLSVFTQFFLFWEQLKARNLDSKENVFIDILILFRFLLICESREFCENNRWPLHLHKRRERLSFVLPKEMLYFDKWNLSPLYLSVICERLFFWKIEDVI